MQPLGPFLPNFSAHIIALLSPLLSCNTQKERKVESEEMSEPSKPPSGPGRRPREEMSYPSKPPGISFSSFASLPKSRGETKNNLLKSSLSWSSSSSPGKK
ncbi:hypothetical protein NC652_013159 [Populus alba x Populus x berolinensis]|nr:hypothetical protein NC652_013159 [Populus alba x Populus x berolinensis]